MGGLEAFFTFLHLIYPRTVLSIIIFNCDFIETRRESKGDRNPQRGTKTALPIESYSILILIYYSYLVCIRLSL